MSKQSKAQIVRVCFASQTQSCGLTQIGDVRELKPNWSGGPTGFHLCRELRLPSILDSRSEPCRRKRCKERSGPSSNPFQTYNRCPVRCFRSSKTGDRSGNVKLTVAHLLSKNVETAAAFERRRIRLYWCSPTLRAKNALRKAANSLASGGSFLPRLLIS